MTDAELNRLLTRIPYIKTLGVTARMEASGLLMIMPFQESNIGNPMLPALHGGAIGGFMEITAVTQLAITDQRRKLPKPIGINVDYLRRGKPEDTYASAVITKQGSRVANVRVKAWQDDSEKPIATLHGHFMMPETD